MAQIVLIVPKGLRRPLYPPAGVLYLAAMVHENYSVKIIDAAVEPEAGRKLCAELDGRTLCVGISALTGTQLAHGLELAALVRSVSRTVPIVWGGVHATLDPEGTLAHGLVDVVCRGEGETVFPALVRALERKEDLRRVPGIGFKENGKAVFTPMPEKYFDLDALPLLPYGLVDFSPYEAVNFSAAPTGAPGAAIMIGFDRGPIAGLETVRGCPYRCSYCVQSVTRGEVRAMSAGAALRQVDAMQRAGIRAFELVNDNFLADRAQARRFLEGMHGRGMQFYFNARADALASEEEDFFRLLGEAGAVCAGIGAESGSDRVLARICKGASAADTLCANRRLQKSGVAPVYSFLAGFPGETLEDVIRTHRMILRLTAENPRARIILSRLFANPGSPLYRECLERGMRPREGLEDWAGVMDLEWSGKPEPYVDPAVDRWMRSTRYFRDLLALLWVARCRSGSAVRRLFAAAAAAAVFLARIFVGLRARFSYAGPGPDTWAGAAARAAARRLKITGRLPLMRRP